MKSYADIDLQRNRLLKAVLENANTATINAILTAVAQLGYDTTILRAKLYDGTAVHYLLQDNDFGSTSTPSTTQIASTQDVVNYVSTIIAAGLRVRGGVTLTANSTYPVATAASYTNGTQTGNGSGTANAIKTGDAWYVTGQVGSFTMGPGGKLVANGDLIIALVDTAGNVDASWLILQSNLDQATETLAGIAEIATTAEVTTGTDDLRFVTPLKLAQRLSALALSSKYATTVTTVSGVPSNIAHNLATTDVVVQVRLVSTGEEIITDQTIVDANNITITMTPGAQVRVIVHG